VSRWILSEEYFLGEMHVKQMKLHHLFQISVNVHLFI
jgi:hypothetical protein